MPEVTYRIVEHDGGWAYQLGSTYSETYPTHDMARAAAVAVAREQKVPDQAHRRPALSEASSEGGALCL